MKTIHRNENGFTITEILIVVAVLGIVGLVGWRAIYNSQQKDTNVSSQLSNAAVLPESLAGIRPVDEIMTTANLEIAERQVVAVNLEQEDEGLVYLIKLTDGTVLAFDAKTGNKVQLKSPHGIESGDDNVLLPAGFKPTVTIVDAIQTAKTQRVGKSVEKVELKVEDGIVVYSVRFSDKGRIDIDATTGSVVRIREPNKSEVKAQDNDNDSNDDRRQSSQNSGDDSSDIDDNDDSSAVNGTDDDDDNSTDVDRDDSTSSGSGSNSGSNSGSSRD